MYGISNLRTNWKRPKSSTSVYQPNFLSRLRMRELRQLVARNSTVEEVQAIGKLILYLQNDKHTKITSCRVPKVRFALN